CKEWESSPIYLNAESQIQTEYESKFLIEGIKFIWDSENIEFIWDSTEKEK
ncbi:10975_t:CDS:1, partial [Racocetra fulgida]